MSATKTPDQALPDNAPIYTKEFIPSVGELVTKTWPGERTDVEAKYAALKASAGADNISKLALSNENGRARLVASFGRTEQGIGEADGVTLIEELYAVDVLRDILEAPYFAVGEAAVTNNQAVWVRKCSEQRWDSDTISKQATETWHPYTEWTSGMIELYHHMIHGVDTYYETAFIFRRTSYGVQTAQVKASFTGLNTAAKYAPTFKTPMSMLITSLPDGEWLIKPPQAEHLGGGKWRVTQEWHWSLQWSKMYGGTWGAP